MHRRISKEYEVAVIGGGPGGIPAAIAAARRGRRTVLIERNANIKLPMASTTKIMTTLLMLESGDLDNEFVIDSTALLTEGSSMNLEDGDAVTKRELCYGMMLPSGNDAANASALCLSENYQDFAEMMNERAHEIGMHNTNFVTPSGLHDANHYSTAYDMALLAREAMKNEDFRQICSTENMHLSSENWSGDKYLQNSNKLLNKYEYCIGIKTGFTDEAGRCLVSAAEKDGVTLICVTLNDPDDWNDHINMYNACFAVTESREIDGIRKEFDINTVGGACDTIKGVLAEIPHYTSINGVFPEISERVYINDFVYAPVRKGDVLGYAEYLSDNEVIARADIKAEENCPYVERNIEKSLYDTFIDWLKTTLF